MARGQVKKFAEHSLRWQRDARRKGVDPKKWDRWRKLSAKSRKATNPADYGRGESVQSQIRGQLLTAATSKIVAVHTTSRGVAARATAVRRNLAHPNAGVSNAKLRKITGMSAPDLAREIDDSLSRRYGAGERSPYWYEKRG